MKKLFIALLSISAIASAVLASPPQRGYRGFIDWSTSVRQYDGLLPDTHQTGFFTGFSTSHGYQFNPWLFVGAGLDYEYSTKLSSHIFAPFAVGRADLQFGSFTPFGDIRVGYSYPNGGGIYFSPSLGYRFNWGRKIGVNVSAGLTLQGYTSDIYDISVTPDGYWSSGEKIGSYHGTRAFFSFRLGIDF